MSLEHRRHPGEHPMPAARVAPTSPAHQHRWFADEIAIDFPSVRTVVERLREEFLGKTEFPLLLSAEVPLSPREASHGVTVELEVPIRGTCPLCGGRGETWMESCAPCSGSGDSFIHHHVRLTVPPGVADGARFHFTVTPSFATPARVEVRVVIREI